MNSTTVSNKLCIHILMIIAISLSACQGSGQPVPSGTVSDVDGNLYHTILIGNQTWMVENLRVTHLNDNTPLALITDSAAWLSGISLRYCCYNNDSAKYKETYGALYNWYAVRSGKLAPKGWHVATDDEWSALEAFAVRFCFDISLSKALCSNSYWLRSLATGAVGNNLTFNNATGFAAVPGGWRVPAWKSYSKLDSLGSWWTATGVDTLTYARSIIIRTESGYVDHSPALKSCGLSVRCVKD